MSIGKRISADRYSATAPHLTHAAQVSTQVQPLQQAVILLPVDEFHHMKEELLSEVRSLGTGNSVAGSSMKEVMTPQEAADVLDISVKHLMELRRARKIACVEDGRLVRFHRSHLIDYIIAHTTSTYGK